MKKVLVPMLVSAMLLGSVSAFAAEVQPPKRLQEIGEKYGFTVEYEGEYEGLPSFSISSEEKLDLDKILAIENDKIGVLAAPVDGEELIALEGLDLDELLAENNAKIEKVWNDNALSKFAEKEKLNIEFDYSSYGITQFRCKVSGISVEELSKKLCHQVVERTDKNHKHSWMYFDVSDENGDNILFRYCQNCGKWQAFEQK